MNEKVYKGIELTAATVASIGVDFVVTKAVTNLVKPETIPEKILTTAGVLGINLAADYGLACMIHKMMYPNEDKKFEELAALGRGEHLEIEESSFLFHNLRTKNFRMSFVASENPLRRMLKKIPLLTPIVRALRECRIKFSVKRTKAET